MAYTFAQLVEYARQAGFPADQAPTAAAVALAESSGNPTATHTNNNRSTDYGLWQINSVHGSLLAGKNWRDPQVNAQMAYAVWKGSGWKAWSTYNSGAYRQYANGNVLAAGSAGASSTGSASAPLDGVTAALDGIGKPFTSLADSLSVFHVLSLPQTWVRVMAGVFGAGLVGFGVVMLTREVRN
jgi:hypothetical protein